MYVSVFLALDPHGKALCESGAGAWAAAESWRCEQGDVGMGKGTKRWAPGSLLKDLWKKSSF